jgi:hypothetical protein
MFLLISLWLLIDQAGANVKSHSLISVPCICMHHLQAIARRIISQGEQRILRKMLTEERHWILEP